MTENDRTEFMTRMAVLLEIHGKESTVSLIDSYWTALRDLSLAVFLEATAKSLRESKFFPKPAELRELVLGDPEKQQKLNAAMAWENVRRAMDKHDYVQSVDFGSVANAVVRNMGGWQALCGQKIKDLTFDRLRFEELYQAMSGTEISAERAAPLEGMYFKNIIRIQMPGEAPVVKRPALPEKESPVLQLVRDLANKKGGKGAA